MKSVLKSIALAALALTMAACATVAPQAAPFNTGDWVLARWEGDQTWYYPAVVTERAGDVISLQYDDGDVGQEPSTNVRAFDWAPGTPLECRWSDGVWYPARIAQMHQDRYAIEVLYDDGDKQSTNTSFCRGQ